MKIAVTGASGWVGAAVCARLAALGHGAFPDRENGVAARMELTDPASVEGFAAAAAAEGATALVHCAARVHRLNDTAVNPAREYHRVNVVGTCNLAAAARRHGIRRFVFVSSIKVNGDETFGRGFCGDDTPAPTDEYGCSKLAAEQGLAELAAAGGLEPVSLRPPLLYGAGVKANFRSLVRLIILGRPLPLGCMTENRRSVAGMRNFADALVQTAMAPANRVIGRSFTFADHPAESTRALVEDIAAAGGVGLRLLPLPVWIMRAGGQLIGKSAMVGRLVNSLEVDGRGFTDALGWTPPFTRRAELVATVAEVKRQLEEEPR